MIPFRRPVRRLPYNKLPRLYHHELLPGRTGSVAPPSSAGAAGEASGVAVGKRPPCRVTKSPGMRWGAGWQTSNRRGNLNLTRGALEMDAMYVRLFGEKARPGQVGAYSNLSRIGPWIVLKTTTTKATTYTHRQLFKGLLHDLEKEKKKGLN